MFRADMPPNHVLRNHEQLAAEAMIRGHDGIAMGIHPSIRDVAPKRKAKHMFSLPFHALRPEFLHANLRL